MSLARLPLSPTITPEMALKAALDMVDDLDQLIIIGWYKDGDFLEIHSRITRAEALYLLKQAEQHTLNPSEDDQ